MARTRLQEKISGVGDKEGISTNSEFILTP